MFHCIATSSDILCLASSVAKEIIDLWVAPFDIFKCFTKSIIPSEYSYLTFNGFPFSSTCPARSSVKVKINPLFRNAISRNRVDNVSNEKSVVSKISLDGQKITVVPESSVALPFLTGAVGTPSL